MDTADLVKLCSRSWCLTALGLVADGTPARTSPLASAAGCGRTAMQSSVTHLLEMGLLEQNPGHGHPLRAQYRLTEQGKNIAKWASTLGTIVKPEEDRQLLRNKWTLPVVSCLHTQIRYTDLRRQLTPVTDRALSRCIGQLTERHWIRRHVSAQQYPPAVSYLPGKTGSRIYRHLQEILVV